MSAKKSEDKQSETSMLKVASKSPQKKNPVSEQFDSDVDIHIEKRPTKTNKSCRSPIFERKLTNANKVIESPIYQGNLLDSKTVLLIFKMSTCSFLKKYVQVIKANLINCLINCLLILKALFVFNLFLQNKINYTLSIQLL